MTEQLERALERVMREAGESAPAPPPGLLARLDDRARRRRKAWIQTGAVCLAAAAAVTAIAIAGGGRVPKATPDPARTPTTSTEVEAAKILPPQPAEKVWPDAVHRLPANLSDGREISPVTFLDDDSVLIQVYENGDEPLESLNRYDLKTREVTKLADLDMSAEGDGYTVTGGYVVWYSEEGGKGEIWGVPVTGGQAQRLATGPQGEGVEGIAVEGQTVSWASWTPRSGRILSAPFGGTPTPVTGSDDSMIVSWPWIGSPVQMTDPARGVFFRELRNVRTNETRSATERPGQWSCHLTWCLGGTGKQVWVEQRDGSLRQQVPSIGIDLANTFVEPPARDRFVVKDRDVIDLVTGKRGQLAGEPDAPSQTSIDQRMHLIHRADGFEIIDLAAIP